MFLSTKYNISNILCQNALKPIKKATKYYFVAFFMLMLQYIERFCPYIIFFRINAGCMDYSPFLLKNTIFLFILL